MKKIRDIAGITSYLTYGGGKGLYRKGQSDFEERIFGWKLHRHFVDNRRYVEGGGDTSFNPNSSNDPINIMVQPSPQNWYTDDYLELLQDNGIEHIWCLQGKFPWQDTIGKAGKVMPLNEADYPNQGDPAVWEDLAKYAAQVAIRYADDTAQHLDKVTIFSQDTWQKNTPKAGLGYNPIIQVLNEPNFNPAWSQATNWITAKGTAAAYVAVYREVRKYSQNTRIITGPPIGMGGPEDVSFLTEMLEHIKLLMGEVPADCEISFHWYIREKDQSQGRTGTDTGASLEFVGGHRLFNRVEKLCNDYGIKGWWITEIGWAASLNGDKEKNAAPIQEGYNQLESQGIVTQRLYLIANVYEKCQGITIWHCRDDYDSGAYAKGGVCFNDSNWTPKPIRQILYDFFDEYGEYSATKYWIDGKKHYVQLEKDGDVKYLGWTDKFNAEGLTTVPQLVDGSTLIIPDERTPITIQEPSTGGGITPPIEPLPPINSGYELTELNLVDASTKQTISNLLTDTLVQLVPFGLTIETKFNQSPDSVKFTLSGPINHSQTESVAPYVLFGDTNGTYLSKNFPEGQYTLKVEAFKGGSLVFTLTKVFTIANSVVVPPIPTEPTSSIKDITLNFDEIDSVQLVLKLKDSSLLRFNISR